jgi:hypothetical protein
MKTDYLLIATLLFLPSLGFAETVHISNLTSIVYELPAGWVKADEPPQALLDIFAEHIDHEAEEKGYSPSRGQLQDAAQKRLAANAVLLYNPQTNAHITIDMSHLRRGEKAPSKRSIQLSAKYAGQSVEQEEGVSGATGQSNEAKVSGAWYAHRYDADYLHHDEKMRFSGIIGFVFPYWFYFYTTNYLKDPADREKIDRFLATISIIKREP